MVGERFFQKSAYAFEASKAKITTLQPKTLIRGGIISLIALGVSTIALEAVAINDLKNKLSDQQSDLDSLNASTLQLNQGQVLLGSLLSEVVSSQSENSQSLETLRDSQKTSYQELLRRAALTDLDKNSIRKLIADTQSRSRTEACIVYIIFDEQPKKNIEINDQKLASCSKKFDLFHNFFKKDTQNHPPEEKIREMSN